MRSNIYQTTMEHSQIVDINISNISKEAFEDILTELTTMITNLYVDTSSTANNIYKQVDFKDHDKTNLDANNLLLIH